MKLNSKIMLVKNIKVDRNYINVLSYSESQMLALCEQNMVASRDDYSFIRSNNSIMTGFTYAQCLQANYIAFQNSDYSNKWFFAWIDDVIFKGNETTEIKYTVDAWSTWFSYWTKNKSCYVIRQHINDDTVGSNTKPEPVNLGPSYVVEQEIQLDYSDNMSVGVLVSKNADGSSIPLVNNIKNKIYNGLILVDYNIPENLTDLNNEVKTYIDAGAENYVSRIFQFPRVLKNATNNIYEDNNEIDDDGTLDGYTPKNKKLLCYPYRQIKIMSTTGDTRTLQPELFNDKSKFQFIINGTLMPSVQMVSYPINYAQKSIFVNKIDAINLACDIECAWIGDSYQNWLNQNRNSLALGLVGNAIGLATSIGTTVATGGASAPFTISAATSMSQNAVSTLASIDDARKQANQIHGNINTNGIKVATNNFGFVYSLETIRKEYARQIDNYFTRFGYTIEDLVEPNIVGRPIFNYLEIGGSEEIGEQNNYNNISVNANDMQIINNACRKGVTIWHNHSNIGNFNLDNSI